MKYVETLTREELTHFVRFYLYRSRPFLMRLLFVLFTIGIGVTALMVNDRIVTAFFVFLMTWFMVGLVWASLMESRQFRVYSQTQYPQEFEFSETGIAVACANGIHYLVPWKHVRRIYSGRSFTYFATAIGVFWVHRERFAEHLPAITALWKPAKLKKIESTPR